MCIDGIGELYQRRRRKRFNFPMQTRSILIFTWQLSEHQKKGELFSVKMTACNLNALLQFLSAISRHLDKKEKTTAQVQIKCLLPLLGLYSCKPLLQFNNNAIKEKLFEMS